MKIARRIFGVFLGVLAIALAILTGSGVAILITHTYWSVKYTFTVTAFSGYLAVLLFRLARKRLTS
jgi:hypothetical protein